MKILYLLCPDLGIPVLGRKGASVHVRELVGALSRAGHSVVLATPLLNKSPWEEPAELEAQLLHVLPAPDVVSAFYGLKAFNETLGIEDSLPGELRRILYNQDLGLRLDRRIAYVRYRPNGNCVVRYVITHRKRRSGTPQELFWYGVCLTPETFTDAHRMVFAKPWVKPTFGPPFIALTEYKTLLFAYPNDRRLDGLRMLNCEDTLREFLCNHLPEERWPSADEKLATTVVRYRPENRAVLRCEAESQLQPSEAAVYLRIYTSAFSATAMHTIMSDLLGWLGPQAKLCIPRPLASDRDQNILLLDSLPGRNLESLVRTSRAREALERTAEALAVLHGYKDPKVPCWTVADHLAKARQVIHLLAQFFPELREQIEEIGHALRAQAPRDEDCASGFVHGDFHYGQVLIHPTKVGFLDFDLAHTGPVVADLGRLLAHFRYQPIKGRPAVDGSVADAFLEAYARATQKPLVPQIISWWTALALLRLGVKPIRRLDADGPNKVKALIEEIEGVLQCK